MAGGTVRSDWVRGGVRELCVCLSPTWCGTEIENRLATSTETPRLRTAEYLPLSVLLQCRQKLTFLIFGPGETNVQELNIQQ